MTCVSNKNLMLLLAISSLVIIISSGLHFSRGQTVEKALPDFNVYENADYKINIQYPKSWHVSEQDLAANVIVQFKAPDTKDQSTSATLSIANYQMPSNTTLDKFVDFFFKERYKKSTDYKLINSSDTYLGGIRGRQFILYDYDKDILGIESTGKVMRIIALDNNTDNGYMIKYWAQPSLFNKYLPQVQKMINSFKIIGHTVDENVPVETNTIVENRSESSDLSFDNVLSNETSILNDQSSYTDENPKLAITNSKLVNDDTDSSIIGEIMNNTTDPINSIHITSSVYNLKNQLIATGDTTTDIDQLRPGEKTGFEISLSSKVSGGGKRVTLSSEYQISDSLKPGFLKVTIGKLNKHNQPYSDYEDYTVVGEVTNLGPETASSVKVAGLFFDKKHNPVDYDYSNLKSDQLESGQKAPFEISIFSKNAGKISSVSLNAQSDEYSMTIENNQK